MKATQLALQLDALAPAATLTRPIETRHPHIIPIATGDKAKAQDILAAIRCLRTIERGKRPATAEERQALARFPGFGPVALSIFPKPNLSKEDPEFHFNGYKDARWQAIGEELHELLTPEEYESAKRTTFNQFFTSPTVMQAMHDALPRLGVPSDALVLEAGCGSGNFMAFAPDGYQFIGVELDSISGRIAKARFPNHQIRIENFKNSVLPRFDAAIGNVPFSDLKLDHNGKRFSLHNYFLVKSVDQLAPGGIMAVVTSHFSLDGQNSAAREYLADRADFLGAIRLPSTAFKNEGTAVVTDIVFLRKRAPGQEPHHADPEWLAVAPMPINGAEVAVNKYFLSHPEQVLGTWSRKNLQYGTEGYSIESNGNLAEQLEEAIGRLAAPYAPEGVRQVTQTEAERPNPPPFTPPPLERHISEGSFCVGDDRTIRQVVDGTAEPVVYGGKTLTAYNGVTGQRLAALIGLRDKARRVLQSQNEGWPEAARNEARRELNGAYDRFVFSYGPINKTTITEIKDGLIRRMPNLAVFRGDPDAMLVLALEEYDEETDTAKKAAIMSRDVVGKHEPITQVKTAEEGLLVSLDRTGGIDLAFISELYGKPEAAIIDELGDLIYRDPRSKKWLTADDYLSGNVRERLRQAEAAGPEYRKNAEALRTVQPEDVLPGDIDANLGAPWIPESDIQAFAAGLFACEPSAITIRHIKKDAAWHIEAGYAAERSVAATTDYGTSRVNGISLFEQALNMKVPTIYDTIRTGDGEERVVNQEETLAAREKQKLIKERFKSWIFGDPDRAERLVRIYKISFT